MIDTTKFTPIRFRRVKMKPSPAERTVRRVRAAQRAVEKDAESVPLFPELRKWQGAEERIRHHDRQCEKHIRKIRASHAASWRWVRKTLRELGATQRAGILLYWRQCTCPAEAHYLADLLHGILRQGKPGGWARLRELRMLKLIGEGRLPKEALFKPKHKKERNTPCQ